MRILSQAGRDKRNSRIFASSINKEHMDSKVVKTKGWVAKDECGLWFFRNKPYRVTGTLVSYWTDVNPNSEIGLSEELFPELTWESEPVEVELTIDIKAIKENNP